MYSLQFGVELLYHSNIVDHEAAAAYSPQRRHPTNEYFILKILGMQRDIGQPMQSSKKDLKVSSNIAKPNCFTFDIFLSYFFESPLSINTKYKVFLFTQHHSSDA